MADVDRAIEVMDQVKVWFEIADRDGKRNALVEDILKLKSVEEQKDVLTRLDRAIKALREQKDDASLVQRVRIVGTLLVNELNLNIESLGFLYPKAINRGATRPPISGPRNAVVQTKNDVYLAGEEIEKSVEEILLRLASHQ